MNTQLLNRLRPKSQKQKERIDKLQGSSLRAIKNREAWRTWGTHVGAGNFKRNRSFSQKREVQTQNVEIRGRSNEMNELGECNFTFLRLESCASLKVPHITKADRYKQAAVHGVLGRGLSVVFSRARLNSRVIFYNTSRKCRGVSSCVGHVRVARRARSGINSRI